MISAQTISPQGQSHCHTATKAALHSVRTAHAVVADAADAGDEVVVESVATHSTALRP
jgi:hypothetical protein